jgi:hypothetical protein
VARRMLEDLEERLTVMGIVEVLGHWGRRHWTPFGERVMDGHQLGSGPRLCRRGTRRSVHASWTRERPPDRVPERALDPPPRVAPNAGWRSPCPRDLCPMGRRRQSTASTMDPRLASTSVFWDSRFATSNRRTGRS